MKNKKPYKTPDMTHKFRRHAVKVLTVGSILGAGMGVVPAKWSKPLINSVVLPAHAITSDEDCTTRPPVSPPPTRPPTMPPPIGGVLVCDANGRNCVFEATVLCGNTVHVGEIFANDSVRVILWGFPPNQPVIVDTSAGNHSCINCPVSTNSFGIVDIRFSTGNKGDHLTTITVGTCVMTVNWTATNPAGKPFSVCI